MSFGFSPGDILTVVTLAWDTYQGAKEACGHHDRLTQEVAGLHKVLQRVHNETLKTRSGGNEERWKELEEHIEASRSILGTMDRVLRKYNALGDDRKKGKRLWQKIEFGNGKFKDLAAIRAQLTSHTASISMSLKLYMLGSLGKVESTLNAQQGELKGIREAIDQIAAEMTSSRSLEGEGSVWTAYEDDDKTFWRDLRRELLRSGFDAHAIAKKKALIKGYVLELGERGVFDEDEDVNDDSEWNIGSEDDKLEGITEENDEDEAVGIQEIGQKKNFSDETEESVSLEEEDLQKEERQPKHAQGTIENKTNIYDGYANGRLNNDSEASAGEDGTESPPAPGPPPGHIFGHGERRRSSHHHRAPPPGPPPSAHRGSGGAGPPPPANWLGGGLPSPPSEPLGGLPSAVDSGVERQLQNTQGAVEDKTDTHDDYKNERLINESKISVGEEGTERPPPRHHFYPGERPRSLHHHRAPPGPPPSTHRSGPPPPPPANWPGGLPPRPPIGPPIIVLNPNPRPKKQSTEPPKGGVLSWMVGGKLAKPSGKSRAKKQ